MDNTSWYLTSVEFDGETYDKDNAGTLKADTTDGATAEEERVSGELYASAVEMVNASATVSIELAEWQSATFPEIGKIGTLVMNVKTRSGAIVPKTWYNMKFGGRDGSQGRGIAGRSNYGWTYQATDGTKGPTVNPAP